MASGLLVEVILDSISEEQIRLPTIRYRAPRCILAEINTHRVFSRNARSSRAVPVPRLIDEAATAPFVPWVWTMNQAGMQGASADPDLIPEMKRAWLSARDAAVEWARELNRMGAHKQVVNRVLEPFLWVDGVISSTDWNNFFALRCHPDAEPHMQVFAWDVKRALDKSTPALVRRGAWHLPWILPAERDLPLVAQQNISAARVARVSYRAFDTDMADPAPDNERGQKMRDARPLHASPFEHIATPDKYWDSTDEWDCPHLHGNFRGWCQLRRMLPEHEVRG